MNELQTFTHKQFGNVRALNIEGEPWFVAADVCRALEVGDAHVAMRRLDTDEKGRCSIPTPGGEQEMSIVNEPGLYTLVLGSRKPEAKAFKRWLVHDVLPSIHKYGAYMTPKTLEAAILNPDVMIQLCMQLKETQQKKQALEAANVVLTAENQEMKPKADYFDTLVNRNGLTGIRETAKALNLGQKKFTSFLIEKKYLYRDGHGNLQPYMKHVPTLFKVKECLLPYTPQRITQTMITPLGRAKFSELCKTLN